MSERRSTPSDAANVQLYTADEAAVLLRCKPSWLNEQARKRQIPFTLVGGSYRFSTAHLLQIIADHEHLPTDATDQAKGRRGRARSTAADAPLRARPPRARRGSE
ncbi:helix-turn-helix domain-containing protein [Jiangella alkaliphila]|uniref:helix-turn-helix domain-containing protein n=1 Tax=Jiangella alkaliphila TaxID=419479 RepID=UPI001364DF4C|nr:helix-turn-helix domain-containing protein [Jiangella alkaliphila]